MQIELVTHCLATENPNFAGALALQLSSLLLDQPRHCDLVVTICMNEDDVNTVRVINHFSRLQHDGISICALSLPIGQLGRRCIGRNYAALHTSADLMWFTDVDHCFCDGILDRLAQLVWPQVSDGHQFNPAMMIFPREIMISRNWDFGDKATCDLAQKPQLKSINKEDFVPKGYNRAIGGVQIVRGSTAKKLGYLNDQDEWQTPINKPFSSFKDDIAYRGVCQKWGGIVKVELPGVYRLRHGKTSYQADKTPEDNRRELAKHQ